MKRSLFVAAAVLSVAIGASYAKAQTLNGGTRSDVGSAVPAGTAIPISFSPVSGACPAELNALGLAWEHQGFDTPSKPAQMRILGTDGKAISGQAYGYDTEQMRLAASDEQHGDVSACLNRVQQARADLPSHATTLLAQRADTSDELG